jgi:hypothetical protein
MMETKGTLDLYSIHNTVNKSLEVNSKGTRMVKRRTAVEDGVELGRKFQHDKGRSPHKRHSRFNSNHNNHNNTNNVSHL